MLDVVTRGTRGFVLNSTGSDYVISRLWNEGENSFI